MLFGGEKCLRAKELAPKASAEWDAYMKLLSIADRYSSDWAESALTELFTEEGEMQLVLLRDALTRALESRAQRRAETAAQ